MGILGNNFIPPSRKVKRCVSKKGQSESDLQYEFLKWLGYQYPRLKEVAFSIPNGGKRTIQYAKRLKREGMKRGVPDLFIAYPSGGSSGLFIEFKKKNRKTSDDQKTMIELLRNNGYTAEVVVEKIEDAVKLVKEYVGG